MNRTSKRARKTEVATDEYNKRGLVIDVTAVSGQSMFTGVQRMVREFAETSHETAVLVRFDRKTHVFRIVSHVPRLRYRRTTGFIGRLRVRLKNFYWSFSGSFREQGARRRYIPAPVRNLARRFYDTLLADSRLEREGALQRRPEWEPQPHQTFVLLDIPVALAHVESLVELAETGDVRFVVYLHDLMPLSHKHLFDRRFHVGVRNRHLRYLDIVTAAGEVVCNSQYTRDQYKKFSTLLETAPAQVLRVLYPPWPAFSRRKDGSTESVADAFSTAEVRVLAVGSLDVRKNMVLLLRALELMCAKGDDVHIVIASGITSAADPQYAAVRQTLSPAALDRLTVLQSVSDDRLVELYDEATVVAVPSLAEGFGLPVVEALSRHRPVVASDATALPELASFLPMTLASPTDPAAWAGALVSTSRTGLASPPERPNEFPADWTAFRNSLLEPKRT